MSALLLHHWRRHRVILAVLAGATGLFQWILARVAPEGQQAEAMRTMISLLPPVFSSLVGDMIENVTARGFIAFGYAHPFPVLLASVWVIRVSAGALAGEIGMGTMNLLAARPVRRSSHVMAGLFAVAAGLLIMVGAQFAGTSLALAGFPKDGLSPSLFAPLAGLAALLLLAFGAVSLMISAMRRATGDAIAWSAGVVAGSFVLDYLARVWTLIEPLRRLSLFMYFQPQAVLRSGVAPSDVVVLGAVSILGATGALLLFGRRDL